MARQVAHEIKNPLRQIRLGVQHLRRAWSEGRARYFDATLEDTVARILAEIDRLDAIARAFSRFASPQAEQLPLEPVDLYAVAREVVRLYTLGGAEAPTHFEMAGEAGTPALAPPGGGEKGLGNPPQDARHPRAAPRPLARSGGGRRPGGRGGRGGHPPP